MLPRSKNSVLCPHSKFVDLLLLWELTAIISLLSINQVVFLTETGLFTEKRQSNCINETLLSSQKDKFIVVYFYFWESSCVTIRSSRTFNVLKYRLAQLLTLNTRALPRPVKFMELI
jgi:hypothetical protein